MAAIELISNPLRKVKAAVIEVDGFFMGRKATISFPLEQAERVEESIW